MSRKYSPRLPTLSAFHQGMCGKEKRMPVPGARCQSKAGLALAHTQEFSPQVPDEYIQEGLPTQESQKGLGPFGQGPRQERQLLNPTGFKILGQDWHHVMVQGLPDISCDVLGQPSLRKPQT